MSILYKSCYSTFYVAERLSDQRTSIRLLFDMMRHKNLFEACVCVLEELLAVTDETFNLAEVPNLYELIESLDRTELVSFCRVLSLVIFEPEDKGNVESLKILQPSELLSMRKSLSGSAVKATDKNHAVLLGLPHLLRSLVELVSAKPISCISGQWEVANGSVLREARAPGHRLTIDLILQLVHRTFGIREFVEEGSSDEWLEEFRTMNRILLGGGWGSEQHKRNVAGLNAPCPGFGAVECTCAPVRSNAEARLMEGLCCVLPDTGARRISVLEASSTFNNRRTFCSSRRYPRETLGARVRSS